jgi:DNA-binding transcriptional ArsR family regulator
MAPTKPPITKKQGRTELLQQQQRRETLRSHPARDQILEVMRTYGRPISPTRLGRITGLTLGAAAYHMRILVSAGLIELADEGRVRGAVEHFYALASRAETAPLTDPIGALLSLCGAFAVPSPDGGYPRPAVLDDRARDELQAILDQLRPRVQSITVDSTQRADD